MDNSGKKLNKRNWLVIAAVLLVLAVCIGVLAIFNAPDEVESGTLTVVRDAETLGGFTMEQLRDMEYIEVEKKIASSSHANDEGLFRGVPLRAILNAVDETLLDSAAQIVARSEDGYVCAYAAPEVAESDNIFVAYSKDGEGLGTMSGGGSGPLRVIVQDDEFGTRSAKYLYELEIR